MEEIKDNEEVKFSNEQINALEKMMNTDLKPMICKEIEDNFIPRALPEGILKVIKKHKQELSERYLGRHLFYDGCIYALEEILKPLEEE
ncbi:MAG: hypothetical protein J6O41_01895 [Clostridia bacterium]|nr:hypothetical protein [Clostridia bacterium]